MTQQHARDSPARTFLMPGDQFPPTVAIPTHPPIRSRHFQRAALGYKVTFLPADNMGSPHDLYKIALQG